MILDFFENIPFEIVPNEEYPFMIPSNAIDFKKRNQSIAQTIGLFPEIVNAFDKYSENRFPNLIKNYSGNYSERYYQFKEFLK